MDNFIPLDSIQIATPCTADWNAMQGDQRTRFCDTCQKNVYNLSDMSRPEAEALVNEKEGKMCAIYFQRADGTLLTDDCPVPLRPVRNRLLHTWRLAATGALGMAVLLGNWAARAGEAAPKGVVLRQPAKAVKKSVPRCPSPLAESVFFLGRMGIRPGTEVKPCPAPVAQEGKTPAKGGFMRQSEPIGPSGLMGGPSVPVVAQRMGDIALPAPAPKETPAPTPTPAPEEVPTAVEAPASDPTPTPTPYTANEAFEE